MRARNAWIFGGIAVLALAIGWLMTRRDRESGPGARQADVRDPADPGARHPDRAAPDGGTREPRRNIPPPRVGSGPPPDAEPEVVVDPVKEAAWARETEAELGRRLAELTTARASKIECGSHECAITLEAVDEASLGTALTRLGEPGGGLVGFADSMTMGAVEEVPEGVRAPVRAHFER